jgi:hypothetical protein
MESNSRTIENVLEDLSFVVSLPEWEDLTEQNKLMLESLYSNSSNKEMLIQKKDYFKSKTLAIKKIMSDWVNRDQDYRSNFVILSDAVYNKGAVKSEQKSMWQDCFDETINAYLLYANLNFHQDEIKRMLVSEGVIEDEISIKIEVNRAKGANEGYLVTDVGKQKIFYVKTFINNSRSEEQIKKIDPCEALVYKILEYIELGPKTYFLIESRLSSESPLERSPARSYIVTEDLEANGKIFYQDKISNKEIFYQMYKEEKFALNMQVAFFV